MIGSMGAVVHADDTIILFDRSLLRPDGGPNTCAGTTDLNSPLKVVRDRCTWATSKTATATFNGRVRNKLFATEPIGRPVRA